MATLNSWDEEQGITKPTIMALYIKIRVTISWIKTSERWYKFDVQGWEQEYLSRAPSGLVWSTGLFFWWGEWNWSVRHKCNRWIYLTAFLSYMELWGAAPKPLLESTSDKTIVFPGLLDRKSCWKDHFLSLIKMRMHLYLSIFSLRSNVLSWLSWRILKQTRAYYGLIIIQNIYNLLSY